MDCVYSSWATDAPLGFDDPVVGDLERLMPSFALAMKSASLSRIAGTLVETYLGRDAGRKVLAGSIRRGVADRIEAVLWFSDLRNYTRISDSADPQQIIPLLNEYADAILPIAPFTETAGTFVNCEGRVQGFNGTVRPLGDARPGWKVLRVLGNLLELDGFDFETSEAVRDAAMPADLSARLSNATAAPLTLPVEAVEGIERLADVPIYFSDAIVRRSPPLQATTDAQPPRARLNARTAATLSLSAGDRVRVSQGSGSALLDLQIDERLADGVVRVAAAHPSTAALGPMFGPVRLESA